MLKILFISTLLVLSLFSKETISHKIINDVYFLPSQSKEAKSEIRDLINNSKEEIIVAIYNFSYKKFLKDLISARKKGVNVTVILDKEKISKKKKFLKTLENNSINVIIPKEKMHLKLAIFDSKYAILGSANWTKESFNENIEIILKTNDKKIISQLKSKLLIF